MKKLLVILLPILLLSSCASFYTYKVKRYYVPRDGIYRTELALPLSRYHTKWKITLRESEKKDQSTYQIIAHYEGEKKKIFIDKLIFIINGEKMVYNDREDFMSTSSGLTVIETAFFRVDKDLIDSLALYDPVKVIIEGQAGGFEYVLNDREQEAIMEFLYGDEDEDSDE